MTAIQCAPIRFMATAALLLVSSLSWAAAPKGQEQLSDAEWTSVYEQIEAHRHRVEGDAAGGYRARNATLGLSQRYHPDGRTQVEGQRLGVSLQLEAYGYGELIRPGTPALRAEVDDHGAVVHYQWDDNLREWWHNRPGTLEQWFELQQRPEGADGGPLQLLMALEVPDRTAVHMDFTGQALRIGEGDGALHYAGLKVWDADGRILSSRMHLDQAGDLLLSIDDAMARYPVTIDPVWSQEVYFKASNTEQGDQFGYALAMSSSLSGDTLVVGAPFEDGGSAGQGSNTSPQSGAAYVFVRFGGDTWVQQAYLKASNLGDGDRFGYSVALSGDTLVVGAPSERSQATGVNGNQLDNGAIESGAAYVFVRDGGIDGSWSQQAYLKASNTDVFDQFGYAVAASGDLVVVGAPGEGSSATGLNGNQSNNDAESSGAVYVYRRTQASGNWLQEAYLKASNTAAEDRFGSAVAIEGFTVIAGAPGEDSDATGVNGDQTSNGAGDSGAVYVFRRPQIAVGEWSQQAYLKASNTGAGDAFGNALAFSEETLVVGAVGEDSNATGVDGNQSDNSAVNSGAAYVFARTGGVFGSWSQQAYLKASNTEAGDGFGIAVALSGNLLAVGAINEDSNARGIDGDQANNGASSSGAAYAFVREAGLWRPQAYIKASNTAFGDQFGYAVAVSGPRLVVGAPNEGSPGLGVNGAQGPSNGAVASGAVYGFLIEPTLAATVTGLAPGGSLTLRNSSGGQTRVVTANGPVSFGTVAFDSPFDVRVTAQPTGQVCTVANGSGNAVREVNDIEVNCAVGTFTISGTLVGLKAGLSVTLRNNDDVLTLSANGTFAFPTLLGPGNTFDVIVTSQPTGQTCFVTAGTGTVTVNFPTFPFIQVVCITNTYHIGGVVAQLGPGDSVTLRNGTDSLVVAENGNFVFPTRVPHGSNYDVTVTAEPVGKTCEVESGSGIALGDVSNVVVRCIVNRYALAGTVSGLDPGRSVTLRVVILGITDVVVNSNGPFSFPGEPLSHGLPYDVTVQTQPVGQTCTVSNGSGVATGDVPDVAVECVTNRYSIGGTLFGLAAGGSLTLQNNGGDDLLLGADGAFVFPTQLLHGSPYAVTVASAPAGQSCVVNTGAGTATANVSNIQVTCVNGNPVTIGGSLSGLDAGRSIRLQNNGRNDLVLTANGAFVFSAPIGEGEAYQVTITTQPGGQTCTVNNGSGVATTNVTDVSVSCVTDPYTIGGTLTGLEPNRSLTLQNNGGDDLVLDANGSFVFETPLNFGVFYDVSVSVQPLGQTCEVSGGAGITTGNVSAVEVFCVSDFYLIGGTLSNLAAGGSITLQNNGADDLTLGADGSFVFSAPVSSGTNYLVSVLAQPAGQSCTVSNASGVATANVTNVLVRCICSRVSFPYTLPDNAPATLIDAINCANDNGAADIIDLAGQTISLTGNLGILTTLPVISTDISLRNGTITRAGENPFRFLTISGSGRLTLRDMVLSNGGGASFPLCGGSVNVNSGARLDVINSQLSGSVSNSDLGGGAICSGGAVTVANSIISGNRAKTGGGLAAFGGQLTISNSVMSGNVADTQGGAIYSEDTDVTIINSTVTGNYQSSAGAFHGFDNNLALRNSIVWGNINNVGDAVQIFNIPVFTGGTTVGNSLIQGGQFGALDTDPLFLAPLTASATPSTAGDFQLSDDSPAIDAGANADVPADSFDVNGDGDTSEDAPDLAGNPRRVDDIAVADTGAGTAPIVDLGAFEKQAASVPEADLSISKTDNKAFQVAGLNSSYTIVVSNSGPSNAPNATVTDIFPASITSVVWTCVGAGGASCAASGSGDINETVDLPAGGSVTFTANTSTDPAATGTLSNTASVFSAVIDPNPANNSATDTTLFTQTADLRISKTDGRTSVIAGESNTYTIVASNLGPSNVVGATVTDTFPAIFTGVTWTCVGAAGGTCTAAGSGNISEEVNLPAGGSVSFTATGTVSLAATGTLTNTASVTVPPGAIDPATGDNGTADTSTIIPAPVLSINSVTLVEGDSGSSNLQFEVTRTTTGTSFTVDYATADGTANAGSDYTTTTGTLSFTAGGAETQTIDVPIIGDNRVEGDETFTLSLSNATGTAQIGSGVGIGTITDNDSATVQFAPISLSQSEASSPMAFTVSLSNPVQSGVTLTVNTAPGTATAADFTAISGGTVSFPADSTAAQTVNVVIIDDALNEDNEQFTVTLSGLSATGNVTLPAGTATATGTIEDDDPLPLLSVADVSQAEGNAGTSTMSFTVNLTPVSGRAVSFSRATLDGTATAPSDYLALAADTLIIPAGETSLTIPVTINGDTTFEGDESFTLALSSVTNATPGSLNATGTIEEDDSQPTTTTISELSDPSVVGEGYPVQVSVTAQSSSPLGEVTVDDGTGASCTAALVPGTAPVSTMSCILTSTTAGSKALTATYAPASGAFAASSGTASQQVDPASTLISVSGPPRSRINTPTLFSFALTVNAPGGGTPTGTVSLSSGSSSCQVSLPSASNSCELSFDLLGPRTVSASFTSSDGNHLASSSSGAGDSQTLVYALSDLLVSKTDTVDSYAEGDLLVYTITLRNLGPDPAENLRLRDPVPAGLVDVQWTCDSSGGASCPASSGSGDIDAHIPSYPVGALLNYSFYGNVAGNPEQILNTATVELPADQTIEDANPANNSASDLNLRDPLFADGFEAATVNAASGSFVLPSAALHAVLDDTARVVYVLDDAQGQAARVYARVFDGQLQYALAQRSGGLLRLGPWIGYPDEPQLRWNASEQARGWVVQSVRLE